MKCRIKHITLIIFTLFIVLYLFHKSDTYEIFSHKIRPKLEVNIWYSNGNSSTNGIAKSNIFKPPIEKACSPARRIVLLKTHKTGGSTLASILGRYAYNHRLNMPKYKSINNHSPFNRKMVKGQSNLHILASHAIYNRPEMDFVFGSDALYVTILREPSAQFESSFDFFKMAHELNIDGFDNPLEEFMRQPEVYMKTPGFKQRAKCLNDQLRILGLQKLNLIKKSVLQNKLQQLDFEFDLVLINEYFDESLVLMKNIFCWEFEDILYFSKKIRSNPAKLSKELKKRIRSWNSADVSLYNYFNRTLWKKIHERGDQFFDDLETFRRMKTNINDKCINRVTDKPREGYPSLKRILLRENLSEKESKLCRLLLHDADWIMMNTTKNKV